MKIVLTDFIDLTARLLRMLKTANLKSPGDQPSSLLSQCPGLRWGEVEPSSGGLARWSVVARTPPPLWLFDWLFAVALLVHFLLSPERPFV